MDFLEIKGYEVPLKHYSLKDIDDKQPLLLEHAIETTDYFVCPQYLNYRDESGLQLSILVPRDLPARLFERNQKLIFNLWSFAFETSKIRDEKWLDVILEGGLVFGNFKEKSKFGRTFELKSPIEAKHVLFISKEHCHELTKEIFTSLTSSTAHLIYSTRSIDNGIIEISRFYAILKINQYLDGDYVIRNSNELAELYTEMWSRREDEILNELGIGVNKVAVTKAKVIDHDRISAEHRSLFLDRLNRLKKEIDDLAKERGVYRHALPRLDYEGYSKFSYSIVERIGERAIHGGGYYTEENVRAAEIDIRNSLKEIRLSVDKINRAVEILKDLLAPELEKLKKYNVSLTSPSRENCEVWLMRRDYRPNYKTTDIIATYKFWSMFQYDKELLTIAAEDLAQKIANEFRPRIEEKLYAIKAIEKLNRIARAYNRDNPDLPEKNPHLSPVTLIFGS